MRQHYENASLAQSSRLEALELAQSRVVEAEKAKAEAEAAKMKAERKADKASELTRSLQASLSAERAMSEGLSVRVGKMREQLEEIDRVKREKEEEVKGLEETVRDLMFSLEAGLKIQEGGGESGEGGSLVVVPGKEKDKGKKKSKK